MKLFISYSRDDSAWTYEFWRKLREDTSHDVWIDQRIVPAADWWHSILENIERCDCFLMVLTPKAVESIYCMAELDYAVALNKPVLPLMLKPCAFPAVLAGNRVQYQDIINRQSLDWVLLKTEQGLNHVFQSIGRGNFPAMAAERPPEPRPKINLTETMGMAEDAATKNNYSLAEKLLEQVIANDGGILSAAARERLDEVRSDRVRGEEYATLKALIENPAARKSAEKALRAFMQKYGRSFDPDRLLLSFSPLDSMFSDVLPLRKGARLSHPSDDTVNVSEDDDYEIYDDEMYGDDDEIYEEAVGLVSRLGKASVSLLQRRLRIGYTRAARLIDVMEVRGVVGPAQEGSKPRDVLPTYTALERARTRARTFQGKRNRDWTPFITTFDDLKIPDMLFCLVPVGSFKMGSEQRDDEKPIHQQTITKPYYIAQYPVTNAQWGMGVKVGVVKEPGARLDWYRDTSMADVPVVGVSWIEAKKFVDWLGCRLPTELEWEYAARGIESWIYPWGNEWKLDFAVCSQNSDGQPHSINAKPEGASWVGAQHMIGNVWEWVSSLKWSYPYRADDGREELTMTMYDYVLRGGSWNNLIQVDFRASYRGRYVSNDLLDSFGFRCVCSPRF